MSCDDDWANVSNGRRMIELENSIAIRIQGVVVLVLNRSSVPDLGLP